MVYTKTEQGSELYAFNNKYQSGQMLKCSKISKNHSCEKMAGSSFANLLDFIELKGDF